MYIKNSGEFKDIIEKIPNRLNNRLFIGMLFFIVAVISLLWIIEYPDSILAPVKIAAQEPPVNLYVKTSGRINIIRGGMKNRYSANEYVAYVENTAKVEDVLFVKLFIDSTINIAICSEVDGFLNRTYALGVVEESYFKFKDAYFEYVLFSKNNKHEHDIAQLQKKVESLEYSTEIKNNILVGKYVQHQIIVNRYKTDSVLFQKEVIVRDKLEDSQMNFLRSSENIFNMELDIKRNQADIQSAKMDIQKLRNDYNYQLFLHKYKIKDARANLLTHIVNWEQAFAIITPKEGKVEFAKFIDNGQYVTPDMPLFIVIPESENFIANAAMATDRAGKVTIGQKVNIKLDSYPFEEFGVVEGVVSNVSMIPQEKIYMLNIVLDNGLKTSLGHTLTFGKAMYGQAEIILQEKRLIYQLVEKTTKLLKSKQNVNNQMSPTEIQEGKEKEKEREKQILGI